MVSKSEIINHLEDLINTGKRVIVYDYGNCGLLKILCDKVTERDLQNVEIWHSLDEQNLNGVYLKWISNEQMNELLKICRLYEFSDKITVISDSPQYGSLFNYVKSGGLTSQELMDVILCKM